MKNSIYTTPYMMYITYMSGKDLLKKMEKAGWTLDRVNGSHHMMVKRNQTLTVPVHANKDLGVGLLNKLLKEAGLK